MLHLGIVSGSMKKSENKGKMLKNYKTNTECKIYER